MDRIPESYDMQAAYRETKTYGEALEKIRHKYPDVDLEILWAMWAAIDAYVDMNG